MPHDTYGYAVTDEEKAETAARAAAESLPCQCRVQQEKVGRGVQPRIVLHMCERHQAEHLERHQRAMKDYRDRQGS